ncbi:hypothetical protein [uncultured Roseobacter sp.]|nr:hypothetical protein [uncultured Roseobacter sp.]
MQKTSIAVYSCFFGDPEPYNVGSLGNGQGYDRILFTDRKDIQPDGVEIRHRSAVALGPMFESRRAKILPHRELPEYDWAIYVDNRASLQCAPADLIQKLGGDKAKPGRYVFRHLDREMVRDELDECFRMGHLSEDQWSALDDLFTRAKLSTDLKLTHNAILIYKAGDSATEKMSELWFDLFLHYSKRDQLTMQVAEHLTGSPAIRMDGKLGDIAEWPVYWPEQRADSMQVLPVENPYPKYSLARLKFDRMQQRKQDAIAARRSRRT